LICEIAPFAGRGQLGSATDPLVVGHHVDFADAELDANAVLTQTVIMPDVGPSRPAGLDMRIGTLHDGTNQPRGFVQSGADLVTDPLQPDIEGAATERDFGDMSGTVVDAFVAITGGTEVEVVNQATLTWGVVHGGTDGGDVTRIAYIEGETSAALNGNPIDAPADWILPTAGSPNRGPELALIADGSSNWDVNNPRIATLPATTGTYTVPTTALQFDNFGGIRGLFRCEGVLPA